ncbi:MAG: ABC transporter permease [Candidatus Pacebacteria bacterium]|nr:ABC transporter permease [Candidatus Paceibacterota bacterium]MDD5357037.1 ABC transporter permease [Candidatus Paceibacterota bacterium]
MSTLFKNTYSNIRGIFGLSFQIAKAEFKLRNEGSYLGILWYLLNPILTFLLLYLIFADRLGDTIPRYPLYLLLGIIIFNFFQSTTLEATRSIIEVHNHLIKSINFRRESLILAIVVKNLFSHIFEIALFFLILIFFHGNPVGIFYYLPILLFFLLFTFGSALILSSLTVFFVDLDNIWNFAVRLIWFGTPIFYSIQNQTKLFYLNLANPVYYFITLARDTVIYHKIPEWWIMGGAVGFSFLTFALGYWVFHVLNKKMAELI